MDKQFRAEIRDFYLYKADALADSFNERCTLILDAKYHEDMSVYQMKTLQYQIIAEEMSPVLFLYSPFYYETGTMVAQCDGSKSWRNGHVHPGGWTYRKKQHLFREQDLELWDLRCKQTNELFYLICGPYNDVSQHFVFNFRPVLKEGLKGVYERAEKALATAQGEEVEFLSAVLKGLLEIKKISEKFAKKAKEIANSLPKGKIRTNMERISVSASRCPWNSPTSFYEALNTLAFLRKVIGALEGVGLNSFGRVDLDLLPFYYKDIKNGVITKAEAQELIKKFLITWDSCYDHEMKMVYYSDHEMENTFTLGGVDANGVPVYNQLTEMFLKVHAEEKIIFPKIKCRFSKDSPKEYLDLINKNVMNGTSTVLYQNDDAVIPALLRFGRPVEEARDYIISGCWDLNCCETENVDGGSYVNMLKPFEYSVHNLVEKMKEVGMTFKSLDGAKSFEEIYAITIDNIRVLFEEKVRITRKGGRIWNKVDPLPLFSSTLKDCIENKRDFTNGGARYKDDHYLCFGLPNIIDSLLAIKELCFDSKKYTLAEFLNAVRNNWEVNEIMRIDATLCHGWGDGSQESTTLADRFNHDLYKITDSLEGTYGGKVCLGHLTYTEIRWWGEKTLATPDGRKAGEYFAQGLTPSRLKKIPYVTDVINSLAGLDCSIMSANSVVNIILPSNKMTLDSMEGFIRSVACSAIQSLQLNCTTKEQLLDAQKHPEKYPDLIVRVTGFSARFTALSPEWQQEFLTRNFYS